jgi:hypothetical protein
MWMTQSVCMQNFSRKRVDNFLNIDNFKLAFTRLQTAPRNFYKEIYYEDLKIFLLFLDKNLQSLINDIEQDIYSPGESYKIFIPKKNKLVRPLSMINFRDLLVYQAIINIIADTVYETVIPHYESLIFGNHFNTSQSPEEDRIFFYKPWKSQWRKFEKKTKYHYESGYRYLAEFDIASFFDTIDHEILSSVLEEQGVEKDLICFLKGLLFSFTENFGGAGFKARHGIPQGPIGSAFLADLYLLYLDLNMKGSKLDIRYIRYVDDIRIFSRNEKTANKSIAYLDLLARDLGLIPQASKIFISQANTLDEILRHQKSKFSLISKEFSKKKGKLKSKTHRNLKTRFINCFSENTEDEVYLDKTLIRFSLYKLNKDDLVRDLLLKEWEKIQTHFDGILFYLRKYYSDDSKVKAWLISILRNKDILFHHIIALIFKNFPDIDYFDDIYELYMLNESRHWPVKYFMLDWLYENNKHSLIDFLQTDNYFLKRKANAIKFKSPLDESYVRFHNEEYLKNTDPMLALQGLYLNPFLITSNSSSSENYNRYILHILSRNYTSYLTEKMESNFSIQRASSFFEEKNWNDDEIFSRINIYFRLFFENRSGDPFTSLINLNLFNEHVFEKILNLEEIPKKHKDYGVNLDASIICEFLPETNYCFKLVNNARNREVHTYDQSGQLRKGITIDELNSLVDMEIKALKEICFYYHLQFDKA